MDARNANFQVCVVGNSGNTVVGICLLWQTIFENAASPPGRASMFQFPFTTNSNKSFLILNWLKLTFLVALTILNALQKDQIVFLR